MQKTYNKFVTTDRGDLRMVSFSIKKCRKLIHHLTQLKKVIQIIVLNKKMYIIYKTLNSKDSNYPEQFLSNYNYLSIKDITDNRL